MRAMITIIPAGTRGDRSRLNAKGAVNIPIAKKDRNYKQKWPKDGILGPFLLDHSLYKPVPKILSGRQYFLKLDGPVVPASQFASLRLS